MSGSGISWAICKSAPRSRLSGGSFLQAGCPSCCPTNSIKARDVKTVYFSEPVTGLPKPVFNRLPVTERPIVSGIIVTGSSALAISRSLVASRRPWPPYQTHGRRRGAKDSGVSKRKGAEGTDVMPPLADNHSYATESAGQCKNGRFSLPLQCT